MDQGMRVCCLAPLNREHQKFRNSGYLFARRFVSEAEGEKFERLTSGLKSRRVRCGVADITWDEQRVPPRHGLYKFFSSSPVISSIAALLGRSNREVRQLTCWVSRYCEGEYIAPHRDAEGTVQIVLSLQQSVGASGGHLVLGDYDAQFRLRPGDAIIFRASSITHFTTPLVSTPVCPEPSRVVAVARYFFA